MENRLIGFLVLLSLSVAISSYGFAQETRTNPSASGRSPSATGRLQKQPPSQEGTCGNADDLARRVEVCAKPWLDLLQGTVEKWPRTDDDAMKLCDSFATAERCIRDTSRKCAKGIQKTIISTLALSIGRARKRECSRAKASAVTKTTMCIEKNQLVMHNWMSNVTGRLSAIELQTPDVDKKINAICCMVHDIEVEIKAIMDPLCPNESALINRLYRTVLEDVIELVCRNPKCNNYLKGYKVTKSNNVTGFIAILLRIVFSLDNQ